MSFFQRVFAITFLVLAVSSARSQSVSGSTTVDIDPDTGMVTVTCETDVDEYSQGYYQPMVACVLTDGNGNSLQAGQETDWDGETSAIVVLQIQGIPGTTYVGTGRHLALLIVPVDDPEDDPCRTCLLDEYNFQQVSDDFFDGGTPYPYPIIFYGPGPEEETPAHAIPIANTTASGIDQQCPTSMAVNQTWTQPLQNDYPSFSTGVGILTSMKVGPVGTNFASVVLYEIVTPTGNSCPANIKTATDFPTITFSAPFVVGANAVWEGLPYASVQNAFYDQHITKSATNILGLTNVTSCQSTATQTYTCNGNTIGTFSLTNTYTSSFISAQPVTFVSVSKQ
jgi:hypothetical protein